MRFPSVYILLAVFVCRGVAAAPPPSVVLPDTPVLAEIPDAVLGGWPAAPDNVLEAGMPCDAPAVVRDGETLMAFLPERSQAVLYVRCGDGWVERASVAPFPELGIPAHATVTRAEPDKVAVRFVQDTPRREAAFFVKHGLLEVRDVQGVVRTSLGAEFAYAILPHFVGDDLIYDPERAEGLPRVYLPPELVFVGLLEPLDTMLVACLDGGSPAMGPTLMPGGDHFNAVHLSSGGKSLFIGLLSCSGIWHRAPVTASDYEKAAPLGWERPFEAKWITQLYYGNHTDGDWERKLPHLEFEGILSTFRVADDDERVWKATVGWHASPCWFDGKETMIKVSKKVLPPGPEVLLYHIEGNDRTRNQHRTPFDVVKLAVGEEEGEAALGAPWRRRHLLHTKDTVYGLPTCGTTTELQKVFEASDEVRKADKVIRVADDLMYYYERMVERTERLRTCAREAAAWCEQERGARPDLGPFIEELGACEVTDEIEEMCGREEYTDLLPSAARILEDLKALAQAKDPESLKKYKRIKMSITLRGGLLDSYAARFDFLLRGLMQQAGYRCVDSPEKALAAHELRGLIRQGLSNPTAWEQVR